MVYCQNSDSEKLSSHVVVRRSVLCRRIFSFPEAPLTFVSLWKNGKLYKNKQDWRRKPSRCGIKGTVACRLRASEREREDMRAATQLITRRNVHVRQRPWPVKHSKPDITQPDIRIIRLQDSFSQQPNCPVYETHKNKSHIRQDKVYYIRFLVYYTGTVLWEKRPLGHTEQRKRTRDKRRDVGGVVAAAEEGWDFHGRG